MTEDLKRLQEDFEAFRKECEWCAIVFNTHQALFHSDKETDELLRKTAGWFFHDYSVISQEYSVILVGRLTEHSGKRGNKNLTVAYLAEELAERSRSTDEIERLRDDLMGYRSRIEDSRHKLVAHRDLSTIRNPKGSQKWTLDEVNQFLANLNTFCDKFARQIELLPCDFLSTSAKGDVLDLIRILRRASNE